MKEVSAVDRFGDMDSDVDPDPGPTLSFTHVGKSKLFFRFLFTTVPVYIVISFLSHVPGKVHLYNWLKWILIRMGRPCMPIPIQNCQDVDPTGTGSTRLQDMLHTYC